MSYQPPHTQIEPEIVSSLQLTPRRLSKFTLFWYLKSLPELTVQSIITIVPVVIGAILTIVLAFNWLAHHWFTQEQIQEAFATEIVIDEESINRWLNDPNVLDWLAARPLWVFIAPVVIAFGVVVGWFVIRILQWRRIKFGCDNGVFWMTGGLFTTWRRELPIIHIQTIEFRSTLLQRILKLRAVSISSAAPEGRKPTIDLLAMRSSAATELAGIVQTAFGTSIATPETGETSSVLIASVDWKRLIVAAANSFEVRSSAVSLYVAYRLLGNVYFKPRRDQVIHYVTRYAEEHQGLAYLSLIATGAVFFFWLFSVGIFISTFANFHLRRNGNLALIEHGLLARRWRTVLLPRVQALTFVESPAQQLMKSGSLRMTLPGTTRRSMERTMLLPAVDRNLTIQTLDQLFAGHYSDAGRALRTIEESLQRLPPAALPSYLLRWVWRLIPICIILGIAVTATPGGFGPLWGLAPLLVFGPIGAILGKIRFNDAGWNLTEHGNFMVRERGLSRTTRITNRNRIIWSRVSTIRLTSGRIATFQASVAGSGSSPDLMTSVMGPHLIARTHSRFQIRGMLQGDARALAGRTTQAPLHRPDLDDRFFDENAS